jgi:ABC-type transport system involved in multi-copper enzyme maturation permease subunit
MRMGLRWGTGPVFTYECLATARRWQLFALRTLAASLPAVGLTLVWWAKLGGRPLTISNLAATGESFFYALVGTQLALILLAAPACTAGVICLDKTRGTLLHMLATDLSAAEIFLGKLAARLLGVLGLVLAPLPVLFGASLLGGIEPAAAVGATLVALGVAVSTATLALTLSVWMRNTYEVLLIVYVLVALLLLLEPMWTALQREWGITPPPTELLMANPFWLAFLPYLHPGTRCLSDQAVFLAVALALSVFLSLVAVLRVRAVVIRQAGSSQRSPRRMPLWFRLWRGMPGPSLDRNPVLWREWHRKRPPRWGLLVWSLYGAMALFFSLLVAGISLDGGVGDPGLAAWVNGLQVALGLLLLSVSSVTALAEERARGSLDVLLTTPLSTLNILQGKWWGAYRPIFLLTVLPGLVAAAVTFSSAQWWGIPLVMGLVLAYGAALTSLGLALATWISHPSRAQILSVILFVLMTIVPFLPLLLVRHVREMENLALASPFFGVGTLMFRLNDPFINRRGDETLAWSCVWLIVYLGAAIVLFVLTLSSFDRCLGRGRGG